MEKNGVVDNTVIKKNDSTFPDHLDFDFLREEGLKHLGELSGKVWTDHNVHDPGITILEVLIYALLDLGYRTKLPITDLLAQENSSGWQDDNFFTPNQILTNNPTTILDYRKMLLDVDGVRNVWLEVVDGLSDTEEQKIYLDGSNNTYALNCNGSGREIKLNGLYRVLIQRDREEPFCLSGTEALEEQKEQIQREAKKQLSQYRNLCEDFLNIDQVQILCEEEIGICADLDVAESVDLDQLYLDILLKLEAFFSPRIRYYTLKELLDKGKAIETIYEGRPFTRESYGFIDTDELEKIEYRRAIYLSDIYRLILNMEGVHSVRNLKLISYVDGERKVVAPRSDGCPDLIYCLSEGCAPVFCVDRSQVTLFRRNATFQMKDSRARILLRERTSGGKKVWYKNGEQLDLKINGGTYREDLPTYFSIQNDFPRVYQIGEGAVPKEGPKLRQAQALQLKGYLVFYDQLLADYLNQLSHLRDLFSLKPDSLRPAEAKHTYFAQTLDTVPGIERLLRFYTEEGGTLDYREGEVMALPITRQTFEEEYLPLTECSPKGRVEAEAATFDAKAKRTVSIEQFRREFSQGQYEVELYEDDEGYFFLLKTALNDYVLISKRRYTTEEEARLEADSIAYFGTLEGNYSNIYQFVPEGADSDAEEEEEEEGSFSYELVFHSIDYQEFLQEIVEDEEDYLPRRDSFLNHLLSRFAITFTDYSLMRYQAEGKNGSGIEDWVEGKGQLLCNFDELSRDRGRAFDYCLPSWGSTNVSGLENRLAALTGIPDFKRRHYCNFEIVNLEADQYSLQFRDYRGEVAFTTTQPFASEEEARLASKKISAGLKDIKNYRVGKTADGKFGLFVEYDDVVAYHPQLFDDPAERDEKLKSIASLYSNGATETNLIDSERAYSLCLAGAANGADWKYDQEYPTLEEAWEQVDDFIQQINGKLSAGANGTLGTRTLRMDRSPADPHRFLDAKGLQAHFRLSPPQFNWEMADEQGNVLMRSIQAYAQPDLAALAFLEITGGQPDAYAFVEKKATAGYQLQLKNQSTKEIIGEAWFKSKAARDKAKTGITGQLGGQSQYGDWLVTHSKSYGWELKNEEGQPLLTSRLLFGGKRKAETAWGEIKKTPPQTEDFDLSKTASGKYRLELIDQNGSTLGVSPEIEAAGAADWIAAIQAAWPHRKQTHYPIHKEAFGFQVHDSAQARRPILLSYHLYRTGAEALLALQELLAVVKDKDHYVLTGDAANRNFSYSVRGRDGHFIARHLRAYETPKEREASLQSTLDNFTPEGLPVRMAEVHRYQLIDTNRGVLLESTHSFLNEEEAGQAFLQLLHLLARPGSAKVSAVGSSKSYQLKIKDNSGLLAAAPGNFGTRQAADAVLHRAREIAFAHSFEIRADIRPKKWKYLFWWESPQKKLEPLYESVASYDNKEAAREAYREAYQRLPEMVVEDVNNDQGYTFQFRLPDAPEPIAVHRSSYNGPDEREEVKEEVQELIDQIEAGTDVSGQNPQARSVDITPQSGQNPNGRHSYRVFKRDQPLAYHPCTCYCTESGAVSGINSAPVNAPYTPAYTEICLHGDIICKINNKYHYQLKDKVDDIVYFISYCGFDTVEEARTAFGDNYLRILHLASDPNNYWTPDEDNPGNRWINTEEVYCEESGGCKEGDVPQVVVPEETMSGTTIAQLVKKACEYPIRLLEQEQKKAGIIQVTYLYYFRILGSGQCPPEEDTECREDWRSVRWYETADEAWQDFRHFLYLLKHTGNYRPYLDTTGYLFCWKDGIVPDENTPLAACGEIPCEADDSGAKCCYFITLTEVLANGVRIYGTEGQAWGRDQLNIQAYVADTDGNLTANPNNALQFNELQPACDALGQIRPNSEGAYYVYRGEDCYFRIVVGTELDSIHTLAAAYEDDITLPRCTFSCEERFFEKTGLQELLEVGCDRNSYVLTRKNAEGAYLGIEDYFSEEASEEVGYFSFDIVNDNFRLARHPYYYDTAEELLAAKAQLEECGWPETVTKLAVDALAVDATETERPGYVFLLKTGAEVLWESPHRVYYEPGASNEEKESARQRAIAQGEKAKYEIMAFARENRFYSKDGSTIVLSRSAEQSAGSVLALHKEGSRSVEGLISAARYYPFIKREEGYGFQLYCSSFTAGVLDDSETCDFCPPPTNGTDDTDSETGEIEGGIIWESFQFYATPEEAECYFLIFELLFKNRYACLPTGDIGCGPYSLLFINQEGIIASHPQQYMMLTEVGQAIERTMSCVNQEGFHLVEHILLRPRKKEDCTPAANGSVSRSQVRKQCMLPVDPDVDCCLALPEEEEEARMALCLTDKKENGQPTEEDTAEEICEDGYIPGADPYSFWATLVLPDWTARYREADFREAFQHLAYREAPAHIGLNIVWIPPWQMCKFERIYKKWLRQFLDKPCLESGDQFPCDLVDCISQLKYCPIPEKTEVGGSECAPKAISVVEASNAARVMLLSQQKNVQALRDTVFSRLDSRTNLNMLFDRMAKPVSPAPVLEVEPAADLVDSQPPAISDAPQPAPPAEATTSPATDVPGTEEPTSAEATTSPVAGEPETEEPISAEATTSPVADEPETEEPTSAEATTSPATDEPETEEPISAEATTSPATDEPETEEPISAEATTSPATDVPETEEPTSAEGTSPPVTDLAGMVESTPVEETSPPETDSAAEATTSGTETSPVAPEEPLSRKEIRRRMRQRMSRYTTVVKATADINMRKSKMFEKALGFLGGQGGPADFKALMDYIIQYGLKRKNPDMNRYRPLIENGIWYYLDIQVMASPSETQEIEDVIDVLNRLKEYQADTGRIAEEWNGGELKKWMDAPVVDQYLETLKTI